MKFLKFESLLVKTGDCKLLVNFCSLLFLFCCCKNELHNVSQFITA